MRGGVKPPIKNRIFFIGAFTSKYLNFKDFSNCVDMMLNKEHLTISGREKISILKEGMNSKRTYYNWDHLDKLNKESKLLVVN